MIRVGQTVTDVHTYLERHQRKELLRFLTCGSVDDGKSTLIGRLLYDTKTIYEDQLAAVRKDSVPHGTRGGGLDLALLTDGLKAEREQGITIDVAYRYFSTDKRNFIIADTPGHEQYTRNMATGASTCQLAVILIDARQGIVAQTKRHSFICSLLGIRHVVVAINKMDLVGYDAAVFEQIKADYRGFAAKLDIPDVYFVPISALAGDNVVEPSARMPWFKGSPLLDHLETVHVASDRNMTDLRFPVQYVIRPNLDFRGFAGTVASGIIRRGDEVMVLPTRVRSRVRSIHTDDGQLEEAFAGQAIVLTLDSEVDVSRGNMIVHPENPPRLATELDALIVWMHQEPLVAGRPYLFKHTTRVIAGEIETVRHAIDVNTLDHKPAAALALNEVGRCSVTLNQEIAFDPYKANAATGSFIMIDRLTHRTVGAGMILPHEASDLRGGDKWSRSTQARFEARESSVSGAARADRMGHNPVTILITGLVLSGKATIAYALEQRLFRSGQFVTVLYGDNMRRGLSRDLGYSADDRSENLRRSIEVARILNAAGLIAICAFVAPHRAIRARARALIGPERYLEVHLSAPVEACRARDSRGLYAHAEAGDMILPGVNSVYEQPDAPDLTLPTHEVGEDECVERIVTLLRERRFIA